VEAISIFSSGTISPLQGIEETVNFSLPKELLRAA
jgi:hypothetical protein